MFRIFSCFFCLFSMHFLLFPKFPKFFYFFGEIDIFIFISPFDIHILFHFHMHISYSHVMLVIFLHVFWGLPFRDFCACFSDLHIFAHFFPRKCAFVLFFAHFFPKAGHPSPPPFIVPWLVCCTFFWATVVHEAQRPFCFTPLFFYPPQAKGLANGWSGPRT